MVAGTKNENADDNEQISNMPEPTIRTHAREAERRKTAKEVYARRVLTFVYTVNTTYGPASILNRAVCNIFKR
jgi:hypothetical protein